MGLSIGGHPQEKWEVEYLCRLPRYEQDNIEISLPPPIHRSSPRYFGREAILFLPRQFHRLQPDSYRP